MEIIKKLQNEYCKKGKYTKLKLVIAIIISTLLSVGIVCTRKTIILDRIPFLLIGFLFISIHFIFDIKAIYGKIYQYRYKIALLVLVYLVVFGYSASSIGIYNDVIQGNITDKYYSPILGKARSIRSDEWAVNAPVFISQTTGDSQEQFTYYNDNLRGTATDMFSLLNPPVKDILTIGKPFNIGFMIFGAERGMSFLWYGKMIALLLISFEFFMMITDKKKLLSLCGMLVVAFSAGIQWWTFQDVVIWGMLALVLIDKFMLAKTIKQKILYAIGILISGISYIFIFYPAWQLTYGYIYLGIFIWILFKNWKKYKINWKDILIIALVILAIGGLCARYVIMSKDTLNIVMNTDYPGERFELGGNGAKIVFSYVFSYIFPYKNIENPSEIAGMISYYPIPMILSIIFLIRSKKRKQHAKFLLPQLFFSIIFSIFTLIQTNPIFAKLTLLYMVPATRLAIPLGVTQILMMFYMMSHIKEEEELVPKKWTLPLAIISSIILVSISIQTISSSMTIGALIGYISGLITLGIIYLLFNMNEKKEKNILIGALITIAIITGATVNPIQKGISVLTDKPVAKKTQEIIQSNQDDNLWIADSTNFLINNYLLASGAKVINSTNIYPNKELYQVILGEDESEKVENRVIYNRYAHVNVEISQEQNKVEKIYEDSIKIYLTIDKIKQLNVKYILTTRDLETFSNEQIKLEKLYDEEGLKIYHAKY